jgi:hypothetical protein
VPPGARLLLKDIPKGLQQELGVGEVEEVKFVEITAEMNTYRDAVRFKNSRQLLLQALREGQRVTVLSLTPEEVEETAFSEPRFKNGRETLPQKLPCDQELDVLYLSSDDSEEKSTRSLKKNIIAFLADQRLDYLSRIRNRSLSSRPLDAHN